MADTIRIGILGLTHDHIWDHGHLEAIQTAEGAELVAAADPHQPLLDQMNARYGPKTYASYEAMLDSEKLDAVYIFADNAAAADLTELAAARGLHVMAEKPMAATLAQAERMIRAAANAGTVLMVHWPFAWSPALLHAIKMAHDGAIGELFQVRYRSAHAGPKEFGCTPYFYNWLYDREKNGAGALIDYCCYGAVLARTVLGQPTRITAMAGRLQKDYVEVDDNAIILMGYHHALAITEASWTQVGNPFTYTPMFYGSAGMIVVPRGENRLLLATKDNPDGQPIDPPALPPEFASGTAYFLSRIRSGQPVEGLCNAEISRDAQEILEAGLISARTGREVSLPLKTSLG